MNPILLETSIGNVWISPTEANHTYISFSRDRYRNPDDGEKQITIRGVVYTGSIHVYRHADGVWYIGPEFKQERGQKVLANTWDRSRSLHVSRLLRGGIPTFGDDVSDSAKKKMSEVILTAFREWSESHEDVFNVADETHRYEQREKRSAEIVELRAKIATLEAEIQALETEGN